VLQAPAGIDRKDGDEDARHEGLDASTEQLRDGGERHSGRHALEDLVLQAEQGVGGGEVRCRV
jgi:hypothetical protein